MLTKKYFKSQTFDRESELSKTDAIARGNYVLCYFNSSNLPDYSELVEEEKVYRVIFYDRNWPDEEVLQKQVSSASKVPFEVVSEREISRNGEVIKSYSFTPEGKLDLIIEKHLNTNGDLELEIYKDENQAFLGSIEYQYDDDTGDLIFSREYAADGKLISECEC